jgi:predicted house-cleaning noncanonical NTP pyrophosphatase (MazG superfamily)
MGEKLVRDKIPAVLRGGNADYEFRRATPAELPNLLAAKMREEVEELVKDPSAAEAADVIEAVLAFVELVGISRHHVLFRQRRKREERGGFDAGIVLIEVGGNVENAERERA